MKENAKFLKCPICDNIIEIIDGDVQQYLGNIYREPSELYLKQVYVDNRLTTRTDDQNFTIDIVKGTKTVDIKAILYDQNEYVSISSYYCIWSRWLSF